MERKISEQKYFWLLTNGFRKTYQTHGRNISASHLKYTVLGKRKHNIMEMRNPNRNLGPFSKMYTITLPLSPILHPGANVLEKC
jgi:hypothetical protein